MLADSTLLVLVLRPRVLSFATLKLPPTQHVIAAVLDHMSGYHQLWQETNQGKVRRLFLAQALRSHNLTFTWVLTQLGEQGISLLL